MKVRLRFFPSVLRPGANNSLLSHSLGLDDATVAHLGYIQPKPVWLTVSGWKLYYMLVFSYEIVHVISSRPDLDSYPDPSTSFYPSKVVPIYKVGMSLESLIIIVLI